MRPIPGVWIFLSLPANTNMCTIGKSKKRRYGLEKSLLTKKKNDNMKVIMSHSMTTHWYGLNFVIKRDGTEKTFQKGRPMSQAGIKYFSVCASLIFVSFKYFSYCSR